MTGRVIGSVGVVIVGVLLIVLSSAPVLRWGGAGVAALGVVAIVLNLTVLRLRSRHPAGGVQ